MEAAGIGHRTAYPEVPPQVDLRAVSKGSFVTAFFFALVYAGLGDKDQAFTWLKKACDERFNRLAYVKVEALWDPLRSDPRFAELLRYVGIPT